MKVIYSGWVSMTPLPTFILEELFQLKYTLTQFLSHLHEVIPSQKTAGIILYMLTSLVFLYQVKGKKSIKLMKRVKIKELKIHIP